MSTNCQTRIRGDKGGGARESRGVLHSGRVEYVVFVWVVVCLTSFPRCLCVYTRVWVSYTYAHTVHYMKVIVMTFG
jgi:hypothetical protein